MFEVGESEILQSKSGSNINIEFLKDKLRKADELLRESVIENKDLRNSNQILSLEVDRLQLQLEQTKTSLALIEEKKAETELEMKKEIKYLLESWLSAKNKQQNLQQ